MEELIARTLTVVRGLVADIVLFLEQWVRIEKGTLVAIALSAGALGFILGALLRRPSPKAVVPAAPAVPGAKPEFGPDELDRMALENFTQALLAKGMNAAAAADRGQGFMQQFKDLKDRLTTVVPTDETGKAIIAEAREVLKRGELRRAVNLIYQAGQRDQELSKEKAGAARSHSRNATVALALAGDLEMAQAEYEAAADCYGRALEVVPGDSDDLVAEVAEKHGTAAYHVGRVDDALVSFRRALDVQERTLGAEHPDLATSLNNLALIHYVQGDLEAAEGLYRRALEIDQKALGGDHMNVATDLNNLALLYKKRGNLKAAEEMFKRSIAIKEKALAADDPRLVKGLKNYAQLLRAMNRDQEAVRIEARAEPSVPAAAKAAAAS